MISHEIQEDGKNSYFNSPAAACMLKLRWQIYLLISRMDTITPSLVHV